jgi:thioesterase domain-containing protein/aryl carrier-like protein
VDSNMNPVPVGVPGELCIGGVQVARGYLNLPELTAERFVANPFKAGERMYRTGDICRWLPDGNIAYIGRRDEQVKIRGYRIELGEVENALQQLPGVKEAVVLAREQSTGARQLTGYVVVESGMIPETLLEQLGSKLPEYMVPQQLIVLDALPLTPNGKVDRKQLGALEIKESTVQYEAPGNATEQTLVSIWTEVLHREEVGVHDNFFRLGGHSLMMIRLLSHLRMHGLELQLSELYKYQTIREQATVLLQRSLDVAEKISGRGAEADYHLICLQAKGEGIPIFILPGTEGVSDGYDELANAFVNTCPVYGLQMEGVFEGERPLDDLKVIAALNISRIRKIQPVGPYRFIGHSFGAHVAYEMCRQLEQQKETIDFLMVLDIIPKKSKLNVDDPADFVWQVATDVFRDHQLPAVFQADFLLEMKNGLEKQEIDDMAAYMMDMVRRKGIDMNGDIGFMFRLLDLRVTNLLMHYQLSGKLSAPIVVAKAKEEKWSRYGDDLGWARKSKSVVSVTIPGDHFSMVKAKGAKAIAQAVTRKSYHSAKKQERKKKSE